MALAEKVLGRLKRVLEGRLSINTSTGIFNNSPMSSLLLTRRSNISATIPDPIPNKVPTKAAISAFKKILGDAAEVGTVAGLRIAMSV